MGSLLETYQEIAQMSRTNRILPEINPPYIAYKHWKSAIVCFVLSFYLSHDILIYDPFTQCSVSVFFRLGMFLTTRVFPASLASRDSNGKSHCSHDPSLAISSIRHIIHM